MRDRWGVGRGPWALFVMCMSLHLLAAPAYAVDFEADVAWGEHFASEWVLVPAGQQVRWQMLEATTYANLWVESSPYGILEAEDGGMGAGCARATEDFGVRFRIDNTALGTGRAGHFEFRLLVEAADEDCPTAAQVAQDWRAGQEAFAREAEPLVGAVVMAALFTLSALVVAVVVIVFVVLRKRNDEPPASAAPAELPPIRQRP